MKRFSLRLPDNVHAMVEQEVQRRSNQFPAPSMNDLIVSALQRVYGSANNKEVTAMTNVELTWKNEQNPAWDSTGTVAESWTATHGDYNCRIDRFTEDEGGGFAYSVDVDGNYLRGAENVSAESFEAAERAVITILSR